MFSNTVYFHPESWGIQSDERIFQTGGSTTNYSLPRPRWFMIHPHLWWFHHVADTTVDGRNPAPPGMMTIPFFIGVSTIPGGAGFHPSTVSQIQPLLRHSLSRIFGTEVDEKMAKESYSACLEQKRQRGGTPGGHVTKGWFVVCKDRNWDFMDADSWWWWLLHIITVLHIIIASIIYDDDVC